MNDTESPALHKMFEDLNRLSERLRNCRDPEVRVELLKQMRLLLGDADKIIDSEMGDFKKLPHERCSFGRVVTSPEHDQE
jgi:hypothetical protein